MKFLTDVAGIVNAEAARLTAAGVNKIIMSSHLQNVDSEVELIKQLRNVDIVISGGGDELLANPGDLIVPTSPATRRQGRVPAAGQGRRRRHGAGRHDPGRVPLRRPPDGRVRRRRPPGLDRHHAVRPGARVRHVGDARLRRRRGPGAEVADHRPAGRLQGRAGGEHHRHHRGARCRAATRTRSGSRRANLGNLVADGFLAAANRTAVGRRPPGGQRRVLQRRRHPHVDRRPGPPPRRRTSARSRRSTCCRSTT